MHNAFLVIRTVFFALLTYFHLLIFIFASWNIAAAKSIRMPAPGASAFLLVNSIFIFLLVPIAYLAERICAKARPAHVRTECAWTTLMSTFQLAASIAITMNGSSLTIYCQKHSRWAMCASSSLLVHVSWTATVIILSYCFTLWVAAATHATSLPDLWMLPVPRVPWFHPDASAEPPAPLRQLPTDKGVETSSTWSHESCAVTKYIAERWEMLSRTERQSVASGPIVFTKGRQSADATRPAWARVQQTRRGIDHPFAHPLPKRKEPPPPHMALPPPPAVHSSPVLTSRRESRLAEVSVLGGSSTRSSWTLASRTVNMFPKRSVDPDLPIPRPNLSEWVPADAVHMGSCPRP